MLRHLFFLLLGFYSQWAYATLPIQHWQAASGARVFFIESRDLPILDVSVDFSAGSSTDTPDKSGRAAMALRIANAAPAACRSARSTGESTAPS